MSSILLYYDALRDIKLIEQVEEFSSEIDNILSSLFKVKNRNIEEILDKTVGQKTLGIVKKLVQENKIDSSDYNSLDKLLNGIKQDLKKIRILKMSLAIDPTPETIDRLFDWVKKNLGEGIVLDIDKDESILGGAIISFDGIYNDLSLRKTLEGIFQTKKDEIMNFAKS
ncbi:MAG: F0F1 ATP synthase subunit delta [Patescibacteria group bacterium]